MVAPLSAKLNQKMQLDQSKALADEKRKQELQEIKLQDAEAKANLGILFKTRDQIIKEKQKLSDSGMQSPVPPLPAVPQASGGIPEFTPGGDDQVATVKTGEAIIPVEAAQDPKNKAVIAQLVDEGRQAQGYKRGTVSIPKPTKGLTGMTQQENMLPIIPVVGRRKKMQGYSMGSIDIGGIGDGIGELFAAGKKKLNEYLGPTSDDSGWVTAPPSVTKQGPLTFAERNQNPGNLVYIGQKNAVRGEAKPGGGNFAGFQNYEDGRAALEADIRSKTQRQGLTLGGTIDKYAPPSDKNNTQRYKEVVSGATGIPINERVPLGSVPALADIITQHEGGYSNFTPGNTTVNPVSTAEKNKLQASSDSNTIKSMLARIAYPLAATLDANGGALYNSAAKATTEAANALDVARWGRAAGIYGDDITRVEVPTIGNGGYTPFIDKVSGIVDRYKNAAKKADDVMKSPTQVKVNSSPLSPLQDTKVGGTKVTPVDLQEQQGPQEQDPAFQYPEATEKWFSEMTKNNFPALQAAQAKALAIKEKGGDGEGFFQGVLKNIYGRPDSLVNPQTVARFIMGTSFGALSGGSLGGSIKWAAQDTLRNYDQLHQQEASDNRMITAQADKDIRAEKQQSYAERKAMLPQLLPNYESEGVYKFLKTGDVKDLGKRRPTSIVNSEFEDFVPRNAPSTAQPVRLYKVPNQDGKGFTWKTKDGQQLPENYVTTKEHSGLQKSISDNHKAFEEKLAKDFDSKLGIFFGSKGGAKDSGNASLQNLPTSSEMASQLSSTLRGMGYPIDAPEMQERAHAIGKIVTDSVIAEHKTNNGKTIDISPHVYRAMLIGNSQGAINSTDFMLSTNKSMDSNKLKDLITAAQNNVYKTEPSVKNPSEVYQKATEKLMALKQEYASKPSNKMQDSDSETGFYRFAKKNLLIK